MVKIELSDSWDTSLSLDELKNKIREFFNRYKIKVKKYTDTQIIGKQGSQFKTRTGSGIWTDPALFPKRLYININTDKNVQIDVKIEESLGLYLLTSGMKQKYRDYFEMLMKNLKEIIPPLEMKSVAQSKEVIKEGLKFCAYCGTQTVQEDQEYCVKCGKKIL